MDANIDRDYVLCECDLKDLEKIVEQLEVRHSIRLVREPSICLTMIRAEDSIEGQEFYLGEALTTECEVEVDGHIGYGLCLGEEPDRAYCLAVADALTAAGGSPPAELADFIRQQHRDLRHAERVEFDQVMRTQVDFKLFEEE
jgi:alpha-D-ribose 1-methylphosphonate 5-triphosphate synthase subunit PhnG